MEGYMGIHSVAMQLWCIHCCVRTKSPHVFFQGRFVRRHTVINAILGYRLRYRYFEDIRLQRNRRIWTQLSVSTLNKRVSVAREPHAFANDSDLMLLPNLGSPGNHT